MCADYFGEVTYMQSSESVARAEYVLITPKSRRFYFNKPNIPGLKQTTTESGDSRVYRFIAENLAPVEPEASMPPKRVAVTVARPNLPYSTASIHAAIQRLRMKALCVSVWRWAARCVAASSSQMSGMWKRVKMPSGVGFQQMPRRKDCPVGDFFP